GADRKGCVAEPGRADRQLEYLVEARRRLPLDCLLDQLEVEVPGEEGVEHADRPQKFVDRDVHILAVARVEHYFLRVAFDVADAQVIAERPRHFPLRTQSASAFHSGSACDFQCLPPGWNSVPPA